MYGIKNKREHPVGCDICLNEVLLGKDIAKTLRYKQNSTLFERRLFVVNTVVNAYDEGSWLELTSSSVSSVWVTDPIFSCAFHRTINTGNISPIRKRLPFKLQPNSLGMVFFGRLHQGAIPNSKHQRTIYNLQQVLR